MKAIVIVIYPMDILHIDKIITQMNMIDMNTIIATIIANDHRLVAKDQSAVFANKRYHVVTILVRHK